MNFRNISAWSIRNPIVPIVLFIGLTLAGLVAFNRMDVNNEPDVDFPAANVFIAQPGAARIPTREMGDAVLRELAKAA